jgi:transcriptional regulator with XRE-family HTH domain
MPQRYFKPDLKKIESLRIKRGLTINDFADKADISRRTLAGLSKKKAVVMSTMRSIAQALDVSVESLLPGYSENPEPKDSRVTIRIEMAIPIKSFTATQQMEFTSLLKALLQSTDQINVTSVVDGSTIVTLDMSKTDAIRLMYLALNMKDDDLPTSQVPRPIVVHKESVSLYAAVERQMVAWAQNRPPAKSELRKYKILKITLVLPP